MGGILKFEVFPELDGFVMTATVEYPNGTPPDVTRRAVRQVEDALIALEAQYTTRSGDPLVKHRLALVGQTLEDWPSSGPHFGAVQGILLDSEDRGIHSRDLMVAWEKAVGVIPGIKSLTFTGMEAGPPGAPIEIWIQGREMDKILTASEALMQQLRKFDGVYQIRSDFAPGKNEMRLRLKPEARVLGLTVDDLARQVYAGFYGDEALRLQRGRDDIRVKVRYSADERRRITDIENIRIRTPEGLEVPLLSVAEVQFSPGYSTITRTDGMRRVAVSADVDTSKANANEIFNELADHFFPQLERQYPGLLVAQKGEKKKMGESFASLKVGFPIAVIGIFIIVATIFRSYAQPFVILFTVPFGIIGAVVGHYLLGYDLSLMSIFGMVALTGVVVNDAIVLIERINENLALKMRFFDAIIHGGRRRFRAIILTSFSTVGGLAPMILETDLQAKFLIPMALALAAGVAFATVLTLVLIPSLLVILNDMRRLVYKLRHKRWPSREEVEPATTRQAHDDVAGGEAASLEETAVLTRLN
jgi:multidrug efflux pump subunit AcrB